MVTCQDADHCRIIALGRVNKIVSDALSAVITESFQQLLCAYRQVLKRRRNLFSFQKNRDMDFPFQRFQELMGSLCGRVLFVFSQVQLSIPAVCSDIYYNQ
ncbi:hypothetical protein D3C87_1509970 [compost metagenome]